MKRALLFACILVCCVWTRAQMGLLATANRSVQSPAGTTATPSDPAPINLPAGTHLFMKLISPLHTTSSTQGSGVYLETLFPVVLGDCIVIPEHTRVLGTVQWDRRPGRVRGRAHLRMHFTQLILPDNRAMTMTGRLQSLPGSSLLQTIDQEGTLEPVDQIDADVHSVVGGTAAGAIFGGIGGRSLTGVGIGSLVGAGLGLSKALFTRGDDISLPIGTRVEMVLQQPLAVHPAPGSDARSQTANNSLSESSAVNRPTSPTPLASRCDTPETVPTPPSAPDPEH